MEDLTGKVIVITGGTRGIGRAIAERCVMRGAQVVVCCRHEPHVLETIEALNAMGGGTVGGMQCDVTCFEEVHAFFEYVADKFGGADVLINDAGVPQRGRLGEMTPFPEEWDYTIATNLTGPAYCSHEALPQMLAKGNGWIVNIGALLTAEDQWGDAAYVASKAGLLAFTKVLMNEVRDQDIHVGVVLPGTVNTAFIEEHPLRNERLLQPEDVAEAVVSMITNPTRVLPNLLEIRTQWRAA